MNPLGNGNLNQIPLQFKQSAQQVKNMMRTFKSNPMDILKQHPMYNQLMTMVQGKNPEAVFRNLASQMGIDANAFIQELQQQ